MQDQVRQALLRIAKSPGGLPPNAPNLRGMLLDDCRGEFQADIRALALAVEIDFLGKIVAEQAKLRTWADCSLQLTQRFARESGLRDDLARWVVESWWLALVAAKLPRVVSVSSPALGSVQPPTSQSTRSYGWWVLVACTVLALGIYFIRRPAPPSPLLASPSPLDATAAVGPTPQPAQTPSTPAAGEVGTQKPKPLSPTTAIPAQSKAATLPAVAISADTQVVTNSIGLKLLRLSPGHWMSATPVRRSDFAAYVAATNFTPAKKLVSVSPEGWVEIVGSWQKPGFAQTDEHPVVGVSWEEASEFCHWLTDTELKSGRIAANQRYKLPSEAEWVSGDAASGGEFPWGTQWPPLDSAGNFAGQEVTSAGNTWPEEWSSIEGYTDLYFRTSPVGAFGANALGFADMAGNVLQWCDDLYAKDSPNHVLRGSSWADYQRGHLRRNARQGDAPTFRASTVGFRVVLATDIGAK
jgi:formylglycine-generating enzyme required for sulfatase activity